MPAKQNDVCMRLVEYSKNGRTFRKWTYERLGERVCPLEQPRHDCKCLAAKQRAASAENDEAHGDKGPSSPLARRLKQQRVQREESLIMQEEEAARKRHRQQQKKKGASAEEDNAKVDSTQKADSYNDLTYQEKMVFKTSKEKQSTEKPLAESTDVRKSKDKLSAESTDEKKSIDKPSAESIDLGKSSEKPSAESTDARRRKKEKSDLHIDERTALKEMSKLYRDLLERFEELRLKQEAQMSAESDSTRLRRLAKSDPSVTEALHEVLDAIRKALHDFKTCANLAGAMLPNASLHERELSHILLELECVSVQE
ncbi:hypothetical protein GCK32_001758 [Trichostrongylus colubriformis]|uniref:Uncharacterized protein n=1 Tax=Trichostrongylus colubriformis TaxID=6319 RepID=A0AAN8FNG2_TRICO